MGGAWQRGWVERCIQLFEYIHVVDNEICPGLPDLSLCYCINPHHSVFVSVRAGVPGAVTNGQITCVAREMVMQRQVSESSDAGSPTASWSCRLTLIHTAPRGESHQRPTLGDGRTSRLQPFISFFILLFIVVQAALLVFVLVTLCVCFFYFFFIDNQEKKKKEFKKTNKKKKPTNKTMMQLMSSFVFFLNICTVLCL